MTPLEGNRLYPPQVGRTPVASTLPMRIQPAAAEHPADHDVNIWRETPLRYIGYADEVGEALEPFIGKAAVKGSYWASAVYGALDAFSTSRKAYQHAHNKSFIQRWKDTLAQIGDAILFHVPATIFIPAFFVGRFREIGSYIASKGIPAAPHGEVQQWSRTVQLMKKPLDVAVKRIHTNPNYSAALVKRAPWIAAFIGIASIPLVGHPIDKAINKLLDATYRSWVGLNKSTRQAEPAFTSPLPQPPSVIKPPETFEVLFR